MHSDCAFQLVASAKTVCCVLQVVDLTKYTVISAACKPELATARPIEKMGNLSKNPRFLKMKIQYPCGQKNNIPILSRYQNLHLFLGGRFFVALHKGKQTDRKHREPPRFTAISMQQIFHKIHVKYEYEPPVYLGSCSSLRLIAPMVASNSRW
jgi:hypothetical protein